MATTRFRLTAVYEPVEDGWVQARIEELPWVITAAPTRKEAAELLLDAVRGYLLALPDATKADHRQDRGATAERDALEVTLSA